MLGTIVNAVAIVVGGALGLVLNRRLKETILETLSAAVNLAVVFVGISAALSAMLKPGANAVLFIISLCLGGLCGEALCIEQRLERFGNFVQKKLVKEKRQGRHSLAEGFVAGSLVFCVGTMSVLGSIESGTGAGHGILFAKSVLDGIIALCMASGLGAGVMLGGVSVLVYQGVLTLLAGVVSPLLTADMLREISIVGGILITAIGLNLLEIFKKRIRVGNMLPALFIPIIYYAVMQLF